MREGGSTRWGKWEEERERAANFIFFPHTLSLHTHTVLCAKLNPHGWVLAVEQKKVPGFKDFFPFFQ